MSVAGPTVFASFSPYAHKVDELRSTLDTMVVASREEPGCVRYDLYQSSDERIRFHLFEQYADSDALEAHRASEHYKAYRAKLPDLLEAPIEVTVLTGLDVAGTSSP